MAAVMAQRKRPSVVTYNVGIRVPEDVYEPLAKLAAAEDRSLNAQIVRCLRACVQRETAQQRGQRPTGPG